MMREKYIFAVLDQYELPKPKSVNTIDVEFKFFLLSISRPLSILLNLHLIFTFPLIYFLGPQKSLRLISRNPISRPFHEIIKNIILMLYYDN